jgi:hypothetical protein
MRAASERIRRQGKNATPAMVLNQYAVREQTVRSRNGIEATLVREFLRFAFAGEIGAQLPETAQKTADLLTQIWESCGLHLGSKAFWTRTDITYAKRPRSTEPGIFDEEPGLIELAERLADAFNIDRVLVREQLFSKDLFLYYLVPIARDVVTALLNGSRLGIKPFTQLSEAGLLPTRSRLQELFGHLVSDIERLPYHHFPVPRTVSERQSIHGLFRRAGLSSSAANAATSVLVASPPKHMKELGTFHNRCLEAFVKVLHQPDIVDAPPSDAAIINRLERFGLTRSVYYRAKDEKFVSHSLRRSSENRSQIRQLARALSLPEKPLVDALME